jgi:peptidoglycan/xylan/chitin deacetylase (PgdA/CDA1 family)
MSASATTFLMYHELRLDGRRIAHEEPGYARYVVSLGAFEAQMRWIAESGRTGMSVKQWLAAGNAGSSAVITFDDGAETDLIAAMPVLETLGFGATCYLTVDFLGRPGFLTHSQARELAQRCEVGCHSMSHSYLDDLDEPALRREIVEARHRLEDICGTSVTAFSCPGGRFTPQAVDIARDCGYTSFATSEVKQNAGGDPPWRLGRVAVLADTSSDQVMSYVAGRGVTRQRIRSSVLNAGKKMLGNTLYEVVRKQILQRNSDHR